MRLVRTVGLFLGLPVAAMAQSAPPSLDLLLTPHVQNGAVRDVGVTLKLEKPNVAEGTALLRMPTLIVSIPATRYDGDAVQARDDAGPLPLTQKDEAPTPTGTYRQWLPTRATVGDVVVTAKAPPRVVDATTRTGPLFDLRADGGGVLGAGITFLPLPNTKNPYRLRVHWDLAALGPDATGAWSLGEGDVQTVGPAELLAFSFYAAGPLKTYRNGNFAMYWLTDPPIAPSDVAARIQKLYAYMSNFFDDANAPYRVFIRHNPHRGGGGTALAKSFMFGWNEATAPTLDSMQDLLAHEMTHNWPKIAGEHGDTAWYSEGNAEFYSLVLSYRAGVLTPDQFLERINKRAADYYSNPLRNVSNGEAAKRFWSDWSAQRIPYGRGFLYLALTDAKIRAKSNNKHSLDDIVLAIQAQQRAKKTPGIADWIALVGKEIGADAQRDYDSMAAGRPVVPTGAFGPCFKLVATKIRPFELGFDEAGLMGDKKIVRGLVAGSAAAQAGLQEGDEIVQASDTLELSRKPDDAMLVRVKRGDGEKLIAYVPRGAAAQSYGWVRNTKIADSACRL